MILPTQRTLFQSLTSILKRTMARGWGGGRVICGRVHAIFNQEITPLEPRPNLILFDLLHCYKKFIHAVGDHHRPRKNARPLRTLRLWPTLMSTAWQSHSVPKNPARTIACQKGLEGWGGGGVSKKNTALLENILDFCWSGFSKVGGIKNHFGPFFLHTFCPPF
jgi:hypothetical protein